MSVSKNTLKKNLQKTDHVPIQTKELLYRYLDSTEVHKDSAIQKVTS